MDWKNKRATAEQEAALQNIMHETEFPVDWGDHLTAGGYIALWNTFAAFRQWQKTAVGGRTAYDMLRRWLQQLALREAKRLCPC